MFTLNLFRKRVPRLLLGQAVFLLVILLLIAQSARSEDTDWELDNDLHAVDHLDPIVLDATSLFQYEMSLKELALSNMK